MLRCPRSDHISLSGFSVDYLLSGAMDSMPKSSKSTSFSWVSLERIHTLRQFHRENQSISKRNYWKLVQKVHTQYYPVPSLTFWDWFLKTFRADLATFILSLHSCGDFSLTSPAYLSQSTSPRLTQQHCYLDRSESRCMFHLPDCLGTR